MTRWLPDDQELDGVAKELAAPSVAPDRIEQARTSLLARATLGAPQAGRAWSRLVAAGAALAAAAALVVWLVAAPRGPKHVITALGPASYERAHDWPDFVVHVTDGHVEVRVAALAADERFRVVTGDAEVEVRGTSFEVRAEHDRLRAVRVQVGRAEVRVQDQHVVVLAAGESWSATALARAELVPASPAPATPDAVVTAAPPIVTSPATTTSRISTPSHVTVTSPHATAVTAPQTAADPPAATTTTSPVVPAPPRAGAAPPAPSSLPGEAEFRAGWASLRANDARGAAGKFDTACAAALHTAFGEDACFWAGAAAKRANDPARARTALELFIATFPSSSRVGEASALLGWILLDAGDAHGAEIAFHRAEQDRVPRVRDSAAKGLSALRAKQP
jgi:TolA-binding protein